MIVARIFWSIKFTQEKVTNRINLKKKQLFLNYVKNTPDNYKI